MQPVFAVADGGLIPDLTRFHVITNIEPYRVNNDNSDEGPRISFAVADGYLCDMTRSRLTCHDQHFPGRKENDNTVLVELYHRKSKGSSFLEPGVSFHYLSMLSPALLAGMGLVKEGKPVPGYPVLPLGSAVVLPVGSSVVPHKGIGYLACAYSVDHVFTCWGFEDGSWLSGGAQPSYVAGGFSAAQSSGFTTFRTPN